MPSYQKQKEFESLLKNLRKQTIEYVGFKVDKLCFPEQLDFLNDNSPFITAITSRRAGKTTACAIDLLRTAIYNSEVVVLYITLARVNASRIVWPMLKKFNQERMLGGIINETTLSIRFPNGSIVYCSGAKDNREIDKFLGMKFKLVYIDEAQKFRYYLFDLIDRVIAPALIDQAGKLKLIGTPGSIPNGPFWDLCTSEKWSHHHWTFFDNPHVITENGGISHKEILERELNRKGVTTNDPTIQREFYGKWIHDSNSLVYCYDSAINHYDSLPQGKYNYVLGIDIGYEDSDALAVLGWNDTDKTTYLIEEKITAKQGITELIEQIEIFKSRYDIHKIVMDMGGLGKKIAEEIIRRYHISIQPAEKTRKFENIELFNDALRTNRFKAKNKSEFAQDCMLLEWDTDKSKPDRKVISDRFHSDICDAVLYAWRESYSFTSQMIQIEPKYGSSEWGKKEAIRMEEEAIEYFENEISEKL
jgi:hypothetical protein